MVSFFCNSTCSPAKITIYSINTHPFCLNQETPFPSILSPLWCKLFASPDFCHVRDNLLSIALKLEHQSVTPLSKSCRYFLDPRRASMCLQPTVALAVVANCSSPVCFCGESGAAPVWRVAGADGRAQVCSPDSWKLSALSPSQHKWPAFLCAAASRKGQIILLEAICNERSVFHCLWGLKTRPLFQLWTIIILSLG